MTEWQKSNRGIPWRRLPSGRLQLGRGPVGVSGDWYEDFCESLIDRGLARFNLGLVVVAPEAETEVAAAIGLDVGTGGRI